MPRSLQVGLVHPKMGLERVGGDAALPRAHCLPWLLLASHNGASPQWGS